MTDEHPPNEPSPDSAEGADSELVSERELDEILAQASSLADDLSEEIGAAGESDLPAKPHRESTEAVDTAVNLDAELRELEKLVTAASDEIDSDRQAASETPTPPEEVALAPSEVAPASLPAEPEAPDSLAELTQPGELADTGGYESEPPATAEAPSASPEVPDFMAELTRPEPDVDSASEASESPTSLPTSAAATDDALWADPTVLSDAAAKPGLVGSDVADVAEGLPETEVWKEPAPAASANEPPSSPNQHNAGSKLSGALQTAASRLSPRVAVLGTRIVALLEVINRPVAGISARVRRGVGWVAIATIGVSLVVYVLSLL